MSISIVGLQSIAAWERCVAWEVFQLILPIAASRLIRKPYWISGASLVTQILGWVHRYWTNNAHMHIVSAMHKPQSGLFEYSPAVCLDELPGSAVRIIARCRLAKHRYDCLSARILSVLGVGKQYLNYTSGSKSDLIRRPWTNCKKRCWPLRDWLLQLRRP